MTWQILLLGFAIGVISGIIGIGGGVLLIPALIWLLGMSQRKAQGTSLAALLLPVGIFAFSVPFGRRPILPLIETTHSAPILPAARNAAAFSGCTTT